MQRSFKIALVSVFAATHAVLYFVSFGFGLWRSWAIYVEPVEGIVLGPWAGFSAAFLGAVVGRMVMPTTEWMFGIVAEPIAVLAIGFLAKGKWKPVMTLYVVMLAAYFAHPFGRWLPMWTILDILAALVLVYPVAKLSKSLQMNLGRLSVAVPLSFVGTATDALTRIFLLIPVGLYSILAWSSEAVYAAFVVGAVGSYVEDLQVVVVSFVVTVPLLLALQRIPGFKYPLT